MCLSITVTATRDVNRTRFKRVLDGATFMSVYSNDRGVSGVFYNETASESVEMDLAGLRELVGANSFDGRVAYVVGRR